jgi:hypothetical protein
MPTSANCRPSRRHDAINAGATDDDATDFSDTQDSTPARRPSAALVLVVLSGFGLSVTLLVWGVTHRRKERAAAAMAAARRAAEEDVTRLGEEIDALDFEMSINQVSGPAGEWRAALDAYEAAKRALLVAQTPYELRAAAPAVQYGRDALRRVRARLTSDAGGQR